MGDFAYISLGSVRACRAPPRENCTPPDSRPERAYAHFAFDLLLVKVDLEPFHAAQFEVEIVGSCEPVRPPFR